MLSWLLNVLDRPLPWWPRRGQRPVEIAPASPGPAARYGGLTLSFDEASIRTEADGRRQEIPWSSLSRVSIRSICGDTDLIWTLTGRDGRTMLSFPMGVPGEAELIRTLQERLSGFDNMAVVEAMSCADDAEFQVWPPLDVTTS